MPDYRTDWLSENPWIVETFPSYIDRKLTEVHPNNDHGKGFSQTLQSKNGGIFCVAYDVQLPLPEHKRQFHLIYIKDIGTPTIYSILRSSEICALSVLCDRCNVNSDLFMFIRKSSKPDLIRIQTITKQLSIHPLWTSLHINDRKSAEIRTENAAHQFYVTAQQLDDGVNRLFNSVNSLDGLVTLFSSRGNTVGINFKDNCGNTLLHLAISCLNLEVVRLLLCLGADPKIKNNSGHSPLHTASQMNISLAKLFCLNPVKDEIISQIVKSLRMAGAQRCPLDVIGCTEDCMSAERPSTVFQIRPFEFIRRDPPNAEEEQQNGANTKALKHIRNTLQEMTASGRRSNVISALSLDGGGVKGLGLVQLLIALEEKLDNGLMDYFDWVAGTSTGSIVAAAMGIGISLREIQKMYLRFKDQVFSGFTGRRTETLENFLIDVIGENKTLADISYPKMFFTTLKGTHTPPKLVLQRTYDFPMPQGNSDQQLERPRSVTIWKAIRRSTAAPCYFLPADGYQDGGLGANNPSQFLISEILEWNKALESSTHVADVVTPGCLVSFGCGIPPQRELSYGILSLIPSTLTSVIEQVAATDGHPVDLARAVCHSSKVPYFRLTPNLSKDISLDETNNSKLIAMMWEAFTYAKTHDYLLDEIAELLKIIGTNTARRPQPAPRR